MTRERKSLLYILMILSVFLCSCGEPTSFRGKPPEAKKTLAELSKVRARAVGVWSAPAKLGGATISNSVGGYFHGPTFAMSRSNEAFVAWRVHDTLDPPSGMFLNGETTVLHTPSLGAIWQFHSPIPVEHKFTASLPQFVTNDNFSFAPLTWNAAAMWGNQGSLYVSELASSETWTPQTRLGSGSNGWLVPTPDGGFSALWIESTQNNRFVLRMARYTAGRGWNLSAGQLERQGQLQLAAEPRVDGLGNLMFAWVERQLQGIENIMSTRFSATGVFENPLQVRPQVLASTENIQSLFLAVDAQRGDAELVYQAVNSVSNNGLYATHYNNGIGWQPARNIDANVNTPDVTSSETPGFSSNESGEIVLAWVEDQTDGVYNYSIVYATRYSPQTSWEAPQPASPPALRGAVAGQPGTINATVISNLHVETSGHNSAVVWVENSSNLSELFVSSHTPQRGFGVPELVTSVPVNGGFIESPSAQMTSVNFPVVIWRQVTTSAQGRKYDVMISAQGGQTGTVITPQPFDPTQPKSVNHIPSTNNCLACHATSGAVSVNHAEVIGTCDSCHNGILAAGKSATHIPAPDQCELCHTVAAWVPAINAPLPPDITPSTNWSVPVSLWNDVVPGNTMFYVHGPELTSSPFGDLALGFVKHTQFNALTGSFERAEPYLYGWRSDAPFWTPNLPPALMGVTDSSMVQWQVVPATGVTCALWAKNNLLYLSSMQIGQNWTTPQTIGTVDGYYQLLSMPNLSTATVIWRDQVQGESAAVNARVILPNGGLAAQSSFQAPRTMNFSEPIVDVAGNVHLAAVQSTNSLSPGAPPAIVTRYIRFNSLTGWGQIEPGPIVPFATTAPVFTQLMLDQGNRVVMVLSVVGAGGDFNGGVYTSRKQNANWSTLARIDRNANSQDFIGEKPVVAYSPNGEMIVAWTEGIQNPSALFDYHIFVARWMSGRWSSPEAIGNRNDHSESDPTLIFTPSGDAYASWVATMANNSVLYVKRYNGILGWDATAEVVSNADVTTRGILTAPALAYVANSGLALAWNENRRTDFNIENTMWISRRLVP